ncbi:MAG: pectinesterase family protein [Erysipelotrichaceae bacterium]|nr:pectinesterase family protein [Erysipelotrichaceae bacterium]
MRITNDSDLQEVLNQTNEGDVLELAEGTYRIKCKIHTPGLTIRGAGADRTKIVWDDYAKKIASDGKEFNTFRTWTVAVVSDHVTIEDLTIINDAGHPELKGQEVALTVYGDDFRMNRCLLTSTLDTVFLGPAPG